ncbi:MAG: hypothetical protein HQ575_01990 [Candidatus Omnitrophica bacterium]|nr:hypothetical protein [Candidatus Omnitrophota bacterium]
MSGLRENIRTNVTESAIQLIGFIELLIGLTTILFVTLFSVFSIVEKPLNVFIFVIASAFISTAIGAGMVNFKRWARVLLLFFSGYVVLLKVLIYLGIIQFTGAIITTPPPHVKNAVSVLYHIFLIIFLTRINVASKFK